MHFMLSLNWLCILNSKPECEFESKIKIRMEGKVKIEKNRNKKKKGGKRLSLLDRISFPAAHFFPSLRRWPI
jgi:RNA-binding protein YlmH